MDHSVQPPSYGIELDGNYRETEGSRLAHLPPPEQPGGTAGNGEEVSVEGLGHHDADTEAKEAAVRQLEL